MQCKTGISQSDIIEWADLLEIPMEKYGESIFIHKKPSTMRCLTLAESIATVSWLILMPRQH